MKKYVLIAALALTPLPGHAWSPSACEAIKSIVKSCLVMKKHNVNKDEAMKLFSDYEPKAKEVAKLLCDGVYNLENSEILSDEYIGHTFYQTCLTW